MFPLRFQANHDKTLERRNDMETSECCNARPDPEVVTPKLQVSLHSFGIALDWDPLHNPQKKPLTCTLPNWLYDIWTANGWRDGRQFSSPDPMHLQYATGA